MAECRKNGWRGEYLVFSAFARERFAADMDAWPLLIHRDDDWRYIGKVHHKNKVIIATRRISENIGYLDDAELNIWEVAHSAFQHFCDFIDSRFVSGVSAPDKKIPLNSWGLNVSGKLSDLKSDRAQVYLRVATGVYHYYWARKGEPPLQDALARELGLTREHLTQHLTKRWRLRYDHLEELNFPRNVLMFVRDLLATREFQPQSLSNRFQKALDLERDAMKQTRRKQKI